MCSISSSSTTPARGTAQQHRGQGDKISVVQEVKQLYSMKTKRVRVFRATPAAQKDERRREQGRRNICTDAYLNVQGSVYHLTNSSTPLGVTTKVMSVNTPAFLA